MNITKPLVSIVVPVYKVEAYIQECIESICHQSYYNLEVILIDDGSPDNSGKICDEYAQADTRIKVIHTENQGVAAARLCGAKNSTGEWICFVDSDDTLPRTSIDDLVVPAMEFNTKIVVGYYNNRIPVTQDKIISSERYLIESIIGTEYIRSGLWGKLYHRSLFSDAEVLNIPRKFKQAQDMLANVRIALMNDSDVILIKESVYNYRENEDSCVHTFYPTVQYWDTLHSQMYEYIPIERRASLNKYLIKARIVSLWSITVRSRDVSWTKSDYAEKLKRVHRNEISINDFLFIRFPRIYLLIHDLYVKFILGKPNIVSSKIYYLLKKSQSNFK